MLKSELLELINQGEGAKLEFKRDDSGSDRQPQQIAKEIVAFANTNGGIILMGVDDDGKLSGIQRSDLQKWLMDTVIRQYMSIPIFLDYEEIIIEDKKIAVISVPMGAAKPYALKRDDREDIYVRRGNTCQLAQREEIFRLFESGGMLSVEKMPINGCLVSELDDVRLESYFTDNFQNESEQWDDEKECFLRNHDFVKANDNTSDFYVTYFACILFAKNPRRYMPQAGIRLIIYKNKKEDDARDAVADEVMNIPFLGIDEKTALNHKAVKYLNPYICREHLNAEESHQRKIINDYPPLVLRELIVNAFAHRDWTKQNQIEIVVYSDCMEITSPGALPNGMTVEKVKAGERVPRNNKILDILRDYRFVENRGMGIRRRVIPEMLKENGCEPIFEATADYFRVILPKKPCPTK